MDDISELGVAALNNDTSRIPELFNYCNINNADTAYVNCTYCVQYQSGEYVPILHLTIFSWAKGLMLELLKVSKRHLVSLIVD